MASIRNDAEHWRLRADEIRRVAERIDNAETKQNLLEVASNYDRLAERATDRLLNSG